MSYCCSAAPIIPDFAISTLLSISLRFASDPLPGFHSFGFEILFVIYCIYHTYRILYIADVVDFCSRCCICLVVLL